MLFYETKKSTTAAIRSANAAESSIAQQRRNDSINRIERDTESYIDSINTAKRFKVDSLNLAAQITSIRQSQKSFEIANRPFIQITHGQYQDTSENLIAIRYRFSNVGNFPAKLLYELVGLQYDDYDSLVLKNEPVMYKAYLNVVLNNTGDYQKTAGQVVPEKVYNLIKDRKVFVYLFNRFEYINLATGKHYIGNIVSKMTGYPHSPDLEPIKNEVREKK